MKKLLIGCLLILATTVRAQTPSVQYDTTVHVSAAEMANLFTLGKVMIAAKGAGKWIYVMKCVVNYNYSAPGYGGGGHGSLCYNTAGQLQVSSGFGISTPNTSRVLLLLTPASATGFVYSLIDNVPVYLRASQPFTQNGGSELNVHIIYQILDIP